MEGNNGLIQEEFTQNVVIEGHRLIIIATKIEEEEWQLSVMNENGIFTNWIEYFPTSKLAIEAGLLAIQSEGLEEFVNSEGFEYLYEDPV